MRGRQTDEWLERYLHYRQSAHWDSYKKVMRKKKVTPLFALQPSFNPSDRDMHHAERLMIPFLAREKKCSDLADRLRRRFERRFVASFEHREALAALFASNHPTRAAQLRHERAYGALMQARLVGRDVRYRFFRRCMRAHLPADLKGLEGLQICRSNPRRTTRRARAARG